jgi:hypothetical protein
MCQNCHAVHIFPNSLYFQKFHDYLEECHYLFNFPISIEKSGVDKMVCCQVKVYINTKQLHFTKRCVHFGIIYAK